MCDIYCKGSLLHFVNGGSCFVSDDSTNWMQGASFRSSLPHDAIQVLICKAICIHTIFLALFILCSLKLSFQGLGEYGIPIGSFFCVLWVLLVISFFCLVHIVLILFY